MPSWQKVKVQFMNKKNKKRKGELDKVLSSLKRGERGYPTITNSLVVEGQIGGGMSVNMKVRQMPFLKYNIVANKSSLSKETLMYNKYMR